MKIKTYKALKSISKLQVVSAGGDIRELNKLEQAISGFKKALIKELKIKELCIWIITHLNKRKK